VYVWALKDFAGMETLVWLGPWLTTKLGWIAAFIYCACAALRLARFNTTLDIADKRFFQGLPSPAAACVVAGLVWALNEYQIQGRDVKWLAWVLTLIAGLTMVSNLKFYSGKDINLRKSVSFSVVVGITLGLVALFTFSSTLPEMLFLLFMGYGVSGYAIWGYELAKGKGPGRSPPAPPAGA
jgi:CDP-diacylglycerol---serine O-phosphatidyltransferase